MMRQPTEMERRVAMAAYDALFIHDEDIHIDPYRFEKCLRGAKAAIRAMREPTVAMTTCNEDVAAAWDYNCAVCSRPKLAWQAMIDAASPPEPDDAK